MAVHHLHLAVTGSLVQRSGDGGPSQVVRREFSNRSTEFLKDIHDTYGSRQIVFELKNVRAIERDHVNQLNRYLAEHFGRFGVFVTRKPLPKPMLRSVIDLWSGQRKCIITVTDDDLEVMVTLFEGKQRPPLDVLKKSYVEFMRKVPA